jgi:DNA-binding transcriptional ArsR family regulator
VVADAKLVVIEGLSRCVACYTRLHVVRLAMDLETMTASKLADELMLSVPVTAAHLQSLAGNGILTDAVVGNRREYRLRPIQGEELPDKVGTFLRSALAKQRFDDGPPERAVAVFSAATAFTYARRVAILKLLTNAKLPIPDLASQLKIPRQAVLRHLNKLKSRGYVTSKQKLGLGIYESSATPNTPIHEQFLKVVRESW